jgi:hypothetical protein
MSGENRAGTKLALRDNFVALMMPLQNYYETAGHWPDINLVNIMRFVTIRAKWGTGLCIAGRNTWFSRRRKEEETKLPNGAILGPPWVGGPTVCKLLRP